MAATDTEEVPPFNHKPFSDKDSIRLLVLQPGDYDDDIQINLIEAPLSNIPDFEALSYVWGRDAPSSPVFCQNEKILVTENCVLALRRLRRKRPLFRKERASRLLWIDAVCVNQNSTTECNHQVQLMAQIYSLAKCVVIWLGEASEESDYAMDLLGDYHKIIVSKWPSRIREYLMNCKLRDLRDREEEGTDILKSIDYKSWFGRLWIIQEYVLSRDARFVCGEKMLHSRKFFQAARSIRQRRRKKESAPADIYLHIRVRIYDDTKSDLFLQHETTMLSLLIAARTKSTSNPKDIIFGMYGLCQRYKMELDPPDYSKSLAAIYINATKTAISHDNSLEVLVQTGGKQNAFGLPSWVPNRSAQPEGLQYMNDFKYGNDEAAKNSSSFHTFLNNDEILFSKGIIIDQVAKCSKFSSPIYEDYHSKVEEGLETRETWLIEQGFIYSLSSWWALVQNLNSYPTGESVEYVFFPILVPYFEPDISMFFLGLKALVKEQKRFAPERIKIDTDSILNQCPKESSGIAELYNILHGSPVVGDADLKDGIRLVGLMTMNNWYTNFFISSEGYIGKSLPEVREGDDIVLIAGVDVPIIARRVGDKYMSLGPAYIHGIMKGEKWPEDENELEDIVFC